MAITVSETKRWASSEIYQEADKAAALTPKAKKISPGKSREVLLKAKHSGSEHSKHHNRCAGKGAAMSQNQSSW